jgi:hypothetical protein
MEMPIEGKSYGAFTTYSVNSSMKVAMKTCAPFSGLRARTLLHDFLISTLFWKAVRMPSFLARIV